MNRTKPTFDSLVNDAAVVYSLPILYDRLMQAINHPRSSITDITRIISNDQGLSARILKLANSPRFGYHAKIDSITEAVTIVGTQQLSEVKRGRLRVIGYAGNSAPDHVDQLHSLSVYLKRLGRE